MTTRLGKGYGARGMILVHSRKLTWRPIRGPMKTTVPLKGGYMGFHVSLGECNDSGFYITDCQLIDGGGFKVMMLA